jgi:hypothetical protein
MKWEGLEKNLTKNKERLELQIILDWLLESFPEKQLKHFVI